MRHCGYSGSVAATGTAACQPRGGRQGPLRELGGAPGFLEARTGYPGELIVPLVTARPRPVQAQACRAATVVLCLGWVAYVQAQGGYMDIPAMFGRAVAEFDARVRQVGDHQWQAATPDEDWTVRDLVNHLAGEDLWAPPLLAGSTIAEVGDRFEGDVLGAEPRAAWTAASAAAVRAAGEDGAMDRIVHLSFGDFPGSEYTLQLFADHVIHAWDLARAIGADEHLDEELVASCATWFEAVEEAYRSAGAIAERPSVPGHADAQTLLLARFGRRA